MGTVSRKLLCVSLSFVIIAENRCVEVPENSKNFPHDINHHVIGMAGQFDDCLLSGEQCENIYDFKMSSNLSN